MKRLYNIEVEHGNLEIYDILRTRGIKLESFKTSERSNDHKVLSVIADSEDMLELKLSTDITLIEDAEAAGGIQTTTKLWTERMKDRFNRIFS